MAVPGQNKRPDRGSPVEWAELEKRESSLWRKSLLLLFLLTLVVAILATRENRPLSGPYQFLPLALLALVVWFGAFVWLEKREISRLRGFLQGFVEGQARAPSEQQLERLFEIVSRSQHSFRELIDSFDRIAFNISLDGELRVINREFADILGLPFAAVVNHPIEEFLAEPTRAEIEAALPRFLEKRNWNGILRVRWKPSGTIRFYECTLYAVVKDGIVVGASGLARDISAQRETESRFTDLFETLHEGVYFAAPDGRLEDVNPAFVRMMGYEAKEDLVRRKAEEYFSDPPQLRILVDEVKQTGVLRDRAVTLRRRDGSPIRVLISCVAIRDSSGKVLRLQGSVVDITERLEMERRLREEQEFVRRLVACFPDIIVVLDTSSRYTFVSPRVRELLGYSPQEFVGTTLEQRPHPEDRETVMVFFRSFVEGKTNFGTIEYRSRHKDGSWRVFRANASPLTDQEGKIIGVVASARDVTQSKRIEQQLLQSEKLAAIGQMVSGVAHELNNPLTAILGVSDLLREKAQDDATRRQTELIQKQARKAAELVQGLLSFSRPSRPKSQRVRLEPLVERAIELRRKALGDRQITVALEGGKELPSIDADPNQLVQVFVNLLINSEQAIASVRDHGGVRIHLGMAEEKIEALIDDDGPGISREARMKVFDPFFTTRRAGGGAGLGLTISAVILKEHGGTIEAQSSPEGGARFRILLPPSESPAVSRGVARRGQRSRSLAGRSILVVDDEEGIRDVVRESLTRRGASVEAVSTAEEAWNLLASRPFDAVLCDFNLEGIQGPELFARLNQREGQRIPHFIFMTGGYLEPERISLLEQKGARVLQKPFQIPDLVLFFEDLINGPPPRANR